MQCVLCGLFFLKRACSLQAVRRVGEKATMPTSCWFRVTNDVEARKRQQAVVGVGKTFWDSIAVGAGIRTRPHASNDSRQSSTNHKETHQCIKIETHQDITTHEKSMQRRTSPTSNANTPTHFNSVTENTEHHQHIKLDAPVTSHSPKPLWGTTPKSHPCTPASPQ